jgi:hypothetical protein
VNPGSADPPFLSYRRTQTDAFSRCVCNPYFDWAVLLGGGMMLLVFTPLSLRVQKVGRVVESGQRNGDEGERL